MGLVIAMFALGGFGVGAIAFGASIFTAMTRNDHSLPLSIFVAVIAGLVGGVITGLVTGYGLARIMMPA